MPSCLVAYTVKQQNDLDKILLLSFSRAHFQGLDKIIPSGLVANNDKRQNNLYKILLLSFSTGISKDWTKLCLLVLLPIQINYKMIQIKSFLGQQVALLAGMS